MEEWRPIVITKKGILYDFTGLYEVSNLGRVRSLNYNRTGKVKVLTTKPNKKGYVTVVLTKDHKSKLFSVHRLVATAYIPNPDGLPVVNHLNEIKHDNRVDNLEWTTPPENVRYSLAGRPLSEEHKKKLSEKLKGKPKSEEHKRKIGEAKKDTTRPEVTGSKNGRAKKVRCIETGEIFPTIKKAQEWLGIRTGICECCQGKLEKAGGYSWEYVD